MAIGFCESIPNCKIGRMLSTFPLANLAISIGIFCCCCWPSAQIQAMMLRGTVPGSMPLSPTNSHDSLASPPSRGGAQSVQLTSKFPNGSLSAQASPKQGANMPAAARLGQTRAMGSGGGAGVEDSGDSHHQHAEALLHHILAQKKQLETLEDFTGTFEELDANQLAAVQAIFGKDVAEQNVKQKFNAIDSELAQLDANDNFYVARTLAIQAKGIVLGNQVTRMRFFSDLGNLKNKIKQSYAEEKEDGNKSGLDFEGSDSDIKNLDLVCRLALIKQGGNPPDTVRIRGMLSALHESDRILAHKEQIEALTANRGKSKYEALTEGQQKVLKDVLELEAETSEKHEVVNKYKAVNKKLNCENALMVLGLQRSETKEYKEIQRKISTAQKLASQTKQTILGESGRP